jgi:hypothetical protein
VNQHQKKLQRKTSQFLQNQLLLKKKLMPFQTSHYLKNQMKKVCPVQKKPIVEEPAPVPVKEEEPVEYDPYLKKPTE